MNITRIAAAALNQVPLDWSGNAARICNAVKLARESGVAIVCLPELCLTGYGCEDAFHAPGLHQLALQRLFQLAPQLRGVVCNIGLPVAIAGAIYNVAAMIVDGEIVGFVPKRFLAGDGLHYEPRWFKPWPEGVVASFEYEMHQYPIGDLIFDVEGIRIGFEICEDAWVGDRPGIGLAALGVDVILNPSASHFAFGKHAVRERFVLEGSRAFSVAYVYANLLGCESGRTIFDGDTLIATRGEIVARGDRFSYQEHNLISYAVDVDVNRLSRYRQASFEPQITTQGRCVEIRGFSVLRSKYIEGIPHVLPEWEYSTNKKHEEFWRAVSLGLFDYLRKSRSHGYVVSLSGGVDSTAASCLVTMMARASVAEIGLAGVKERLHYIPWISKIEDVQSLARELLTCVYQGSENSSSTTRDAAMAVAVAIGATFVELNISKLVKDYEELVGGAMGVELSWQHHDLAKQNIQARVRSPSVWLIANIRRALLLSTSNRSEAAVGYTTMDGDSSGGLSPLGGIDKAYLREWLRWLEVEGPVDFEPISALSHVNKQQPTAELRPPAENQTDEGDLMPYVMLDRIERLAIRDKKQPSEVFAYLIVEFEQQFTKSQIAHWIERFFTLWSTNQWKRERYAPSFHLDDENLDPKTWCRFPILSASYREELEMMRKGM